VQHINSNTCKSELHTIKTASTIITNFSPVFKLQLCHGGEVEYIKCAVENKKLRDISKIFSFNLFREHSAPLSERV